MRLLSYSCLILFLVVSSCWGQNDKTFEPKNVSASVSIAQSSVDQSELASKPMPTLSKIRSVDDSIRQKLDEPCNLNYKETPWREIEQQLEKHYGFNIVLTSSAIDDSLSADEPLTENLTGISVRNALRIMLIQKNATFVIEDGVMKIISLDDAEDVKWFSTRFINVRPLLANISTLEKARIGKPRIDMNTKTNKSEDKPVELVTPESLLTDLIHSTYLPDQWQNTGQGLATISIIGGYAVVNCNEEFADGLRNLLTDLNYHLSQN